MDSSHRNMVPSMVPSQMAGGLTQSSSSSGIFFPGDGQYRTMINSHFSLSFGNSSNSGPGPGRANRGILSADVNGTMLNSVSSSGPSVGASSLVTDANSGLSGGAHLQRSASINTDSYMRLPASPVSFSSNNISGSSVVDGSTVVQQGSHHGSSAQQPGASSATSLPTAQTSQPTFPTGVPRMQGSFIQDPNNISHVPKKPQLDLKQEEVLPQQVLHQLLQRQDQLPLQGRNPQLQLLYQQQRIRQQQQILQSMSPLQQVQLQQQQQLRLRQQLQQQGMQQLPAMKRPNESGVCARRLMQYLYHQRQRPPDNSISYWRKFVTEYYSPRGRKRWCLSRYDNVGNQALGAFPRSAMDAWHCDICGTKSGRGFEATFPILPRLNEVKFSSGVVDELLFLDLPREHIFPSGIMVLEYGKAVQESVHEQLRVVREGHLRVIFAQDLKILSWEFCARRHEELLPRRVVAPQVNQVLQVAQRCQSTIAETGPEGVSQQDVQTNSQMVLSAGRQLARSLELQTLNDLGFSKRYVRCLQIAEVVNSMADMIDFCRDHKLGPVEGLKKYPRDNAGSKHQMQKMEDLEQFASARGLPTDRNTLNRLMALDPGLNNLITSNSHGIGRGSQSGTAQAALALTNYQNMLIRQNSMSSNLGMAQHEASSSINSSQMPSPSFGPRSLQGLHVSGLSSPGNSLLQQSNAQASQGGPVSQQRMIQQLQHETPDNNPGGSQHLSLPDQNMSRTGFGFRSDGPMATPATSNVSGSGAAGRELSQSNSYKAASNNESSGADSNNGVNQGAAPSMSQNHPLQEDMLPDISNEFMDTAFFNYDMDDYSWK